MKNDKDEEGQGTGKSVLLIIDMISCWDFPDADKLIVGAQSIARNIGALKRRCARADVPVIYANDNQGQWRSDFVSLAKESKKAGGVGAEITEMLMPGPSDYFVLKPKHSVFFGTPMELLLKHLGAERIFLAGVASDQCILASAIDARMRDLEVIVPGDCVASQTTARNEAALRQLRQAHAIETPESDAIDVDASVQGRESRTSTTGQ